MPFSIDRYLENVFRDVVFEREQLASYQHDLIRDFEDNPYYMGLVGLGLGKTAASLTLIRKLLDDEQISRPIVFAPIRVARQTWPNEIRKWRHLAPLTFTVIRGEDDDPEVEEAVDRAKFEARRQAAERGLSGPPRQKFVTSAAQKAQTAAKEALARAALLETTDIHVINREKTEWLADRFTQWIPQGAGRKPKRRLVNFPYDLAVIDEASSYGDYTTKRFKAMQAMRTRFKRLIELTASPAAQNMLKLFALTYLVDEGQRFGKLITPFKQEYFDENKYTHAITIKPGAQDAIGAKIADIATVMRPEDYLPNGPKATILPRPVKLLPREMKAYNDFMRNLVLEVPDGPSIEAETAAILAGKLCQYASGAVYDADRKVHHIHAHKIEELKQIIEEADNQPVMVPYWYRSSLLRLQAAFPKAATMDRLGSCVSAWNARKIKLLLIHPASAGHGLNMQDGGHLMAFFDLPWSNELFRQMIGRLARQGQRHPVLVYLLTATGTVDDRVAARLQAMEDAQDALFSHIMRLRAKLLTKNKVDISVKCTA
jgi:hypothetical protein